MARAKVKTDIPAEIPAEIPAVATDVTIAAQTEAATVISADTLREIADLFKARKRLAKATDLWPRVLELTGGQPLPLPQIELLCGMLGTKLPDGTIKPWAPAALAPIKRILRLSAAEYNATVDASTNLVATFTEADKRRLATNAARLAADMQERILLGASLADAIAAVEREQADAARSDAALAAAFMKRIQKMLTDNAVLLRSLAWADERAQDNGLEVIHSVKALRFLDDEPAPVATVAVETIAA